MELAAGDRLGPYEILTPLGQGGMGQVYKAKDTRLDRTVAIKILPALLAADRQFRERFDREARAISQLDHPHICPLHDVGQHDGTAYLVMTFLEGETLEQRLQRGALPPAAAIEIATQVADALARAHSAGIIHRDLKPANIMLTRTGARLLDFGLATSSGSSAMGQWGQTQTARLTGEGTIIGTFHYMAPEQIEGSEGDTRTDVWGFGCVLYEMLSGARPFDGRTPASVLASILNAPAPPLLAKRAGLSPAVDHVVRRCLEKDPEARWQSMADVAHELRWASAPHDGAATPAPSIWTHPAVYVTGLLFAAGGFLLSWFARPPAPAPVSAQPMKLAFTAPAGLTITPFGSNGNPHFALSPDGLRIAYVAAASGRAPTLWVQRLDTRTPREVPGSTDAVAPFWSPDSQSIAFFSEGRLRRSGLESEQSQVLTRTDATGGTWAGDVILVGGGVGPIERIPAGGGRPTPVTSVAAGGVGHRWPQFLPDGRHFVYGRSPGGGVEIAALGSTASAVLIEAGASSPVVAGPSDILFGRSQTQTPLSVQPIDLEPLRLTGTARELLDNVRYAPGSGYPPASVSSAGLLAYWDGTTVATGLSWYDRKGAPIYGRPVPPDPATFDISPDGRQVAYLRRAIDGGGIWLMDPSGVTSLLTVGTPDAVRPIWSRDGTSLSFTTVGADGIALKRRLLAGNGSDDDLGEVALTGRGNTGAANYYANDWSRDGRTALISVTHPATGRDIVVFSADSRTTTPFVARLRTQVQPRFSPDERWIAYSSDELDRWEVFVERYPGGGSRQQVSSGGGAQPVWRGDGKELFYVAPDGTLMAVGVTPGDRWVPASPRPLFATRMRPVYAPFPYTYDVTDDGQRFLLSEVRPGTGPVISIVTNWRDYLK